MDELTTALRSLRIDRASGGGAPRAPGSPEPRSTRAFAVIAAVVVASACGLAWVERARSSSAPAPSASGPTSPAAPRSTKGGTLAATGYLVARRTAKLAARALGRVKVARVALGDRVREGDVLFELDDAIEKKQVDALGARARAASARAAVERARLAEIELELARATRLVEGGAATRASAEDLASRAATARALVDAANAEARAASADAETQRATLVDRRVTAPFDGVIATVPAALGDVVSPGVPLAEIVDPASIVVEVEIPEARLEGVREGARCSIVLDAAAATPLTGEARLVHPRVDRAKATATIDVAISPQSSVVVRPDMAARVTFEETSL